MSDVPDDFPDDEDAIGLSDALEVVAALMDAFDIISVQRNSHAQIQAVYERPDRMN